MLQQLGGGTRLDAFRIHAGRGFHRHPQVVHRAVARQHALVVRRQFRAAQDQLLDLGREHVDAADDHHVVAAAGDLFHPAHGACGAGQQARQIARAVADDGQRLLGQAGEHQLAFLAVGHRLAGIGVDDLGVEQVFPDGGAVLGLHAFARHPGAHHLRQAVDVDRVDVHARLDGAAHLVGPGLGTEDAQPQREFARIEPHVLDFLGDRQHVAGRDHDDVGLEVLDQLDLALGLAATERHHGQAQPLGAVVRAQPAGEQAVAVADVHHVTRPRTGGADAARHGVGPDVDVLLRVADHGRLAGGAAAGVDAHDLLARHGEDAEGVAVAQILLGGEGELGQVRQLPEVVRVHAGFVELASVDRRVGVGCDSAHRCRCRA